MLLIKCPWCGERAQTEFSYGGDATVARPDPDSVSDQEWADYIYIRKNPKGALDELWQHNTGCRRFFKVRRNVVTHEIIDTAPPNDELAGGDE
jgi:heterotetrameric sarcosine oxidase delta subunit